MHSWLTLSIVSGLCAALNGLFAKLVTTTLTTEIADKVAGGLGVGEGGRWVVEGGVRGICFVLNLVFNAIMWGMFTAALTRGSSATKVSVINTSSNFMLTAFLGSLVFAERLPPLWFLGAALLIGGSVIIGRRDGAAPSAPGEGYAPVNQDDTIDNRRDDGDDDEDEAELQSLRDLDQGRQDFGSDTEGSRAGFSGRETPGTTENEEDDDEDDSSDEESGSGAEFRRRGTLRDSGRGGGRR